jgi:hypothetical protein
LAFSGCISYQAIIGIFAERQGMKISFFRTPTPRQFSFRPRYYDERKEQLNQIRARYSGREEKDSAEKVKERIAMRWGRRMDQKTRKKSSTLTLLIYLLIIALLVWFIFFV